MTNRSPPRSVAVLLLAEDLSGYAASILSRRTGLPEPMWDLDNTSLLGRKSHWWVHRPVLGQDV